MARSQSPYEGARRVLERFECVDFHVVVAEYGGLIRRHVKATAWIGSPGIVPSDTYFSVGSDSYDAIPFSRSKPVGEARKAAKADIIDQVRTLYAMQQRQAELLDRVWYDREDR